MLYLLLNSTVTSYYIVTFLICNCSESFHFAPAELQHVHARGGRGLQGGGGQPDHGLREGERPQHPARHQPRQAHQISHTGNRSFIIA